MIKGAFTGDIPILPISVTWGRMIQTPLFILDTGFTGDLLVTPQIAKELDLKINGATNIKVANGDVISISTATARASMEGRVNYVQVLISESMPLAGISLLSKFSYKAIVDCKNRDVILERA